MGNEVRLRREWETKAEKNGDRGHETSFWAVGLSLGGQLTMMRADRADRKALG